ncbi:hypothetical protein U1Q18_047444, partial [Sarracenia purpurea var. burkii]
ASDAFLKSQFYPALIFSIAISIRLITGTTHQVIAEGVLDDKKAHHDKHFITILRDVLPQPPRELIDG